MGLPSLPTPPVTLLLLPLVLLLTSSAVADDFTLGVPADEVTKKTHAHLKALHIWDGFEAEVALTPGFLAKTLEYVSEGVVDSTRVRVHAELFPAKTYENVTVEPSCDKRCTVKVASTVPLEEDFIIEAKSFRDLTLFLKVVGAEHHTNTTYSVHFRRSREEATLTGLALSDLSGKNVTLRPPFDPQERSYSAGPVAGDSVILFLGYKGVETELGCDGSCSVKCLSGKVCQVTSADFHGRGVQVSVRVFGGFFKNSTYSILFQPAWDRGWTFLAVYFWEEVVVFVGTLVGAVAMLAQRRGWLSSTSEWFSSKVAAPAHGEDVVKYGLYEPLCENPHD